MPLTLKQRHLFKAADILRGKMDAPARPDCVGKQAEAGSAQQLGWKRCRLMDGLPLTGRVRVTPLLNAAATA